MKEYLLHFVTLSALSLADVSRIGLNWPPLRVRNERKTPVSQFHSLPGRASPIRSVRGFELWAFAHTTGGYVRVRVTFSV